MARLPIIADSGAPEGSTDYTTVVLFHGYSWTSEAFRNMLPLAKGSNARLILANRRDYGYAAPFTFQERADLFAAAAMAKTEPEAARTKIVAWMRERAFEVYNLLVDIVTEHKIPLASLEANTGGIMVGGWSFGVTLMTAFLANMASFPVGDVDLRKYLRKVVFLDPPDFGLGLPLQIPLLEVDALGTREEREAFAVFHSGYFKYDVNDPATYATAIPLPDSEAVPTWKRLTPGEVESMFDLIPGDVRGGTDSVLMGAGVPVGAFDTLRRAALYLSESDSEANGSPRGWDTVEVRHVWGDHSVATILWGVYTLRAELEKEKKAGTRVRKVTFARVEGANHFMSLDLPERTLDGILRA